MIIKTGEYLTLVKWLSKQTGVLLNHYLLCPVVPEHEEQSMFMLPGNWEPDSCMPKKRDGYEYLHEFYVVKDVWEFNSLNEDGKTFRLKISPKKQEGEITIPDELWNKYIRDRLLENDNKWKDYNSGLGFLGLFKKNV
jgi:hypothetical protein